MIVTEHALQTESGARTEPTLVRDTRPVGGRGWVPAALLVSAGLAVRAAHLYPEAAFANGADSLNTGLSARAVLRGEWPVFWGGDALHGAPEAYAHALIFLATGPTRAALAVAPFLASLATMAFLASAFRRQLPRTAYLLALALIAIPPPAVLFWSSLPVAYSFTLMFCAAALWAGGRMLGSKPTAFDGLLFGCSCGLAFWNSAVSLGFTAPLLAWTLASRAAARRRSAWVLAGLCLGAAPWIAHNVVDPLDSFRVQPNGFRLESRDGEGTFANAGWILTHDVPELIVGRDTSVLPAGPWRRAFRALAVLDTLLLLAAGLRYAWLAMRSPFRRLRVPGHLLAVLFLCAACVCGLKALSSAGDDRGLSVRYVLPLWPAVVPFLGLGAAALHRVNRTAAWGAVLVLATFDFASAGAPWQSEARARRERARAEDRLLAELRDRKIRWVYGDYWDVYGLNFLSAESVGGLPDDRAKDYSARRETFIREPDRLMLLGLDLGRLRRSASESGVDSEPFELKGGFYAVEAPRRPHESTRRLLARLDAGFRKHAIP